MPTKKVSKPVKISKSATAPGKIELPVMAQETAMQSIYPQNAPKAELHGEETTQFAFEEKDKLITTFTAGGVVLSFGLSIGSVIVAPAWPAGGGLLATLGIISCFGAFMARESI
jgi:hypothetical protein